LAAVGLAVLMIGACIEHVRRRESHGVVVTLVLLAHRLARVAGDAGDHPARTWLQTARTLLIVVALLPAVVLGGGFETLDAALGIVGSLVLLLLIVVLFRYSGRPWAQPASDS